MIQSTVYKVNYCKYSNEFCVSIKVKQKLYAPAAFTLQDITPGP
jgi:hypothetical protein